MGKLSNIYNVIDINIYHDYKGSQDDSENDKMYSINSILGEQRGKHDSYRLKMTWLEIYDSTWSFRVEAWVSIFPG